MNDNRQLFIRVILAAAAVAFIFYIRDVMVPVVISLFLFYILNPFVSFLSNKRPKGLGINISIAILFSFALTALVLYLFFRYIIPPIAFEFKHFASNIPIYIEAGKNTLRSLREWYLGFALPDEVHNLIGQSIQGLLDTMIAFGEQSVKGVLSVTTKFIQLVVIPVLTYYLLKDKGAIKEGLVSLAPAAGRSRMKRIISKTNKVLNGYVKGILILSLVIGMASALGLYFLGVKYFLILGIIAGITEAIPFVGPWIGAAPAVIVAALASPILAAQVALLYILIQFTENHLLVPKVLGDQLELHPIAIIIAILVLGKLAGAWGLFFAAPIVAMLRILYEEVQEG